MADLSLMDKLGELAEAIREVPDGPEHQQLVTAMVEVLDHLAEQGLILRQPLDLTSRRPTRSWS